MRHRSIHLALVLVVGVGCQARSPEPSEPAPQAVPATTSVEPQPTDGGAGSAPADDPQEPTATSAPDVTTPPDAEPDAARGAAADVDIEKARVGVGVKGRGYGGGIITEPARARFRIQEKIIFDQVTYALKLYKAEHGEAPQSDDEFMEKIIRANRIQLPTLPTGSDYWYDAEREELMVRRPR